MFVGRWVNFSIQFLMMRKKWWTVQIRWVMKSSLFFGTHHLLVHRLEMIGPWRQSEPLTIQRRALQAGMGVERRILGWMQAPKMSITTLFSFLLISHIRTNVNSPPVELHPVGMRWAELLGIFQFFKLPAEQKTRKFLASNKCSAKKHNIFSAQSNKLVFKGEMEWN